MKTYLVSAIYLGERPPNTDALTWDETGSEVLESFTEEVWEGNLERLYYILKERYDNAER